MSDKAPNDQEGRKDIPFEDDEDIEEFMTSYSTQPCTQQTEFDDDDHLEDYMQSYSTPERKDSSDIERGLDDGTKHSWENDDSFEVFLKELKYESPKIVSEDNFEGLLKELKYYESPKIDSEDNFEGVLKELKYESPKIDSEDNFEGVLKELKYESPKIDSEDSFEEVLHELKYESPKIDSDMGSECYFSDDEVLDYMGGYNTQTFSRETNVALSLDLKSLTDNPVHVELSQRNSQSLTHNPVYVELRKQSKRDNIGRRTEHSFQKPFLPNRQTPGLVFKKLCFISEHKAEVGFKKPFLPNRPKPELGIKNEHKTELSFKKPYTSKWSENFIKQHIEGKHRSNKPVNTVADFQTGGFKILRKSGSSKNSVVAGRHEGQIKVVTKEAISFRETGFKRRGQTGSKLFMVTAKKMKDVDSVVPEHLDGAATWENGKIRFGQEIYSQCTQQTQRYMC